MELVDEFCKEVGIKKACCYLLNEDTDEIRFYSNLSGLYKKPVGWNRIDKGKFNPRYPNLLDPYNFTLLLNVQWDLFGKLGDCYKRNGDESFEENYLKTRLQAMKMCKSYGGGDMLEEYKKQVKDLPFYWEVEDER